MTDSGDQPPRKKKRAKRKEPDFIIDPNNPNKTIELETADLLQLGQTGTINEIIRQRTRELQLADLEELRPGMPVDEKVIVDLGPDPNAPPKEPNVFVDLGPELQGAATEIDLPRRGAPTQPPPAVAPPARVMSPLDVQRVTPKMPRVQVSARSSSEIRVPRRRTGTWLVVVVYLMSAMALGVSIYYRFVA